MKIKVTAVFDIGKTNKKFFLFDSNFQEVHREYNRFEEIKDEDGFPTENLAALEKWVKSIFYKALDSSKYEIVSLNFSTYGASFVHIDKNGKALTPLYNYLKPISDKLVDSFYEKYGSEDEMSRVTGSPRLAMLNSGMQLYWLKHTQPAIFDQIAYSLHLPQYLSYLFTGVPKSDYTSIGCHTLLWDFEKEDYHKWVYEEGIDSKLAPIISARETIITNINGQSIAVGPGIHDSSSALLPYIRSINKPFLLISTGTWSISINPFNKGMLTTNDIENDSLFNMRIDGSPVKASRLFLGNEYKLQTKILAEHFKVSDDYHKTVKFDRDIFKEVEQDFKHLFHWTSISSAEMPEETVIPYSTFEQAYHQLMMELVLLQVKSIQAAIGGETIKNLYIDGGFSDNEIYIQLLSHYLSDMKISTTDSSLGSALGAAIVISAEMLESDFLKKNYSLKKYSPLK